MAFIPPGSANGGSGQTVSKSTTVGGVSSVVAGTNTSWHMVVLWFLGGVALIALAEPAPQIATMLVVLIILGALLNNWPIYKSYLGMK